MKNITLLLATLLCFCFAKAQHFQENSSAGDVTSDMLSQAGGLWMDYNNDYIVDLIVMGYDNTSENRTRVYKNNGAGNFSSIASSDFYIIGTGGPSSLAGDFDNDGDTDIYQLNFQNSDGTAANNVLYENSGSPNFEFQATTLVGGTGEETYSGSGSWVDYDYDGDLDLFATGANGTPDLFYRNDGGSFTKIETLSFLTTRSWFITVDVWFDYDGDGDLDVYFSNFQNNDNKLYLSQFVEIGDPDSFIETSVSGITDNAGDNIGCNWIDYDNDLDLDLFLNYFNDTDKLYENNGDGTFTEITNQPMTQNSGWTTVNSWADYDNDGDLDLYQNSGGGTNFPGFLYENDGTGNFTSVSSGVAGDITNNVMSPQGGGWGDYDNDGDMDLTVITCCTTFPNGASLPNIVYENKVGQDNNFSKIYLEGVQANKKGIGATIELKATINGTSYWQTRRINGGIESFGMQEEQMAHFGLGDATEIEELIIKWPSGNIDTCTNLPIGGLIMTEGSCTPTILSAPTQDFSSAIRIYPNPSNGRVVLDNSTNFNLSKIKVVNVLGEEVLNLEKLNISSNESGVVLLNTLKSGIYFMLIQLDSGDMVNKKIILE